MHCKICLQSIEKDTTWSTLFDFRERTLCLSCDEQLEKIREPTCKKCMKRTEEKLCSDCMFWEQHLGEDPLDRNISIYTYNEYMKEMMSRFKYRGDYEIVYAWKDSFQQAFHAHFSKGIHLLPIPLAESRIFDRGFNQAEALARLLDQPLFAGMIRTGQEKQSKRTKWERLSAKNPFELIETPPENVIIIDDLFTTGSTVRFAAQLLKKAGAKCVSSLTLVRS
ncbi:ComF family protein [Allobacillus sp. GCM10007491]|uniref:ComF family protein n=1 Tax=Allobacillus saliphilus TaxID=2912308 RepID=A0A941CU98_9BACI|nr:ComF family protein [Allobacillus saliphilus]MBR7552676.1 ComF family protein [Allobacillus saliphilus]